MNMRTAFEDAQTMEKVVAVAIILAIIGSIVLFCTYLSKKNEDKFDGFAGWLYNFLHFKNMLAETLLKIVYLICSIFITITAIGMLLFTRSGTFGEKLLVCMSIIIFGNILVRLGYEFMIVILIICRNTTEINRKLGADTLGKTHRSPIKSSQPMTMGELGVVFCRNCGNKYNDHELACPHCGARKE